MFADDQQQLAMVWEGQGTITNICGSKHCLILFYILKNIFKSYEIKLERESNCDEAVWCKIVQEIQH